MDLPVLKRAIINGRRKWSLILDIATHKKPGTLGTLTHLMSRRCSFCFENLNQPFHLGSPFKDPSQNDLRTRQGGLCEIIPFLHSGQCPVKFLCHKMIHAIWTDNLKSGKPKVSRETIAKIAKALLERMSWLWEDYALDSVD